MSNIFLAKETRAGELRVALIPNDVATLIEKGHAVYVESDAGLAAGFADKAYQAVGAHIIKMNESTISSYTDVYKKMDMIVRAKRPDPEREKLELQAFKPGTIMIGALDPLESGSSHVDEYHSAGIQAYSIDQADLPPNDPMNILAAMSRLAGQLALNDALAKCKYQAKNVVIIGLGAVGRSALAEASRQKLNVAVVVGDEKDTKEFAANGITTHVINRSETLQNQQKSISSILSNADIVITSARKAGQKAPLLIPKSTLDAMKEYAVIVDMSISEGGNVYGSKHDETIKTDRNILIVNVSGYPKVMPHEASKLWSKASLHFILTLSEDPGSVALKPC